MLTFIDESGYPRPTDSTKNPILLGVCIHENDIKPITNQIYKLKSEYAELTKQKSELTATYKNCEKEVRELNQKLETLNKYLDREDRRLPPTSHDHLL